MYDASDQGWGSYYDSGEETGIGDLGGLDYSPDLEPVGAGASYYPRDTADDAAALAFLGFLSQAALAAHVGTTGTQAGDMKSNAGAWSPPFRAAVLAFQKSAALGADSWIGPNTRRALAAAVAKNNAIEPPFPPNPGPIVPPGPRPNLDPAPPKPSPKPAAKTDNTLLYAGGAVVGVGVLYGLYRYMK